MHEIPLTRGHVAIIDDDDFDRVSPLKWFALITGKKTPLIYATRIFGPRKNKTCLYLHRFILNAPPGIDVDHINHDTLDCRKANLRTATRAQNAANNRHRTGISGYKGVIKYGPTWSCFVSHKYYGRFNTPEDAARHYDTIAKQIYGQFATLNFPS